MGAALVNKTRNVNEPDLSLKEIQARIRILWTYVRSPSFKGRLALDNALEEIAALRQSLRWHLYLRAEAAKDVAEWRAALEWVEADTDETETDMLETLSRRVPRRTGETEDDYVLRLRTIVNRTEWGPDTEP